MICDNVGHFLTMLPIYVRAVFGDDGFVDVKRSDDDDFLLFVNVLINVRNLQMDSVVEKINLLEEYFIYDENRHPLSVTSIIKIEYEYVGGYCG